VSLRRDQLIPVNKAVNEKEQLGKGLEEEEEEEEKNIFKKFRRKNEENRMAIFTQIILVFYANN
jgi:hypothetical protein